MRNRYVDYLRGTAILLVLALHFLILPPSLPGVLAVAVVASNGYYGVSIFFVISGYLITSRILAHFGSLQRVSFKEFYAMRAGRIVPCLLAILAILLILNDVGPRSFHDPHVWKMAWYALTFRFNIYRNHFSTSVLAWDVLWSLSIEEVFYIVFPLVCRTVCNQKAMVLVLMAMVAYGPLYRHQHRNGDGLYAYLGCSDLIAMGCVTAIVAAVWPPSSGRVRKILAMGGAAVLAGSLIWLPIYAHLIAGPTVVGLGAAAYLYAFHGRGGAAAPERLWAGGLRPLAACGRLSYEIYLFHGVIALCLLDFYNPGAHPVAASLRCTALFCILTFGISGLVAKFYSEPAGRFLRRILAGNPR